MEHPCFDSLAPGGSVGLGKGQRGQGAEEQKPNTLRSAATAHGESET